MVYLPYDAALPDMAAQAKAVASYLGTPWWSLLPASTSIARQSGAAQTCAPTHVHAARAHAHTDRRRPVLWPR
jgi:hypothetical protein